MPAESVVLITGAASGIGRALAHEYAPRAERLLLLDVTAPEATAAELDGRRAQITTAAADVRDAAALGAAVTTLADGQPLDLVIHCAGVLPPLRPLESVLPEEFQRTVEINLTGSFHLVHAVLPHLREGSGLALVASMGGLVAGYRYPAYSASKFGVVGLAETIRMELSPRGISTHLICPGEVSTPMVDAEIAAGDSVQRAVKLLSGKPITAERAAREIARALRKGQFLVIPTLQPRVLSWTVRFSPVRLRHAITDASIRRATRKS